MISTVALFIGEIGGPGASAGGSGVRQVVGWPQD